MKKLLILPSLLLTTIVNGQNINYQKTNDQPIFPKYSVNLDLLNMDANFANTDNISFNAGLWGYASVFSGLEAQYNLQKSYLLLGKLVNKNYVGNTEINVGVAYFLPEFSRNENVKVILSQKTSFDGRYTLTNYINVPCKVAYKFGVEGGIHYRISPYEFESETNYTNLDLNMSNFGMYFGPVLRRSNSVRISYDNGKSYAINSANCDIFMDALVLPVNTFKDAETKTIVSETIKNEIKQFPIGFRAGCRLYQSDTREHKGKRFGLCYSGAIGKKPYQGWFMSASLGITILKK
jgi:hypothetical protein